MIKYVYICSAGHSGSTLLDLLLGSHSRSVSLGEIAQLPKNIALNSRCSCGSPLSHCEVWQKIISILNRKLKKNISKNPYALNLGFIYAKVVLDKKHSTPFYQVKKKILAGLDYYRLRYGIFFFKNILFYLDEVNRHSFLLYNVIRETLAKQIIIDSSKTYLRAVNLYMADPASTRLILLTRDGRGVLYSNLKKKFPAVTSVKQWKNYYSRTIRLLNQYVAGKHCIRLRYEDLAGDPEGALKLICDFLNIKYERRMLAFASTHHHILGGNDLRFSKSSEIRPDFKWKVGLSRDDLYRFERIAGKLNNELGYH